MAGINHRPLPNGNVTITGNGNRVLTSGGGHNYLLRPNGSVAAYVHGNTQVSFRGDGSFHRVRLSGMEISHGIHGERRVVGIRPDGARIVSFGSHRGFVERPLRPGLMQRTYIANGVVHTRMYRSYSYNGVIVRQYVPVVYYRPAFYQWAVTPWPRPVAYAWGWNSEPWYGYYGPGYFTPYAVYPAPAQFLTDYVIAENLRLAYQQQSDSSTPAAGFASPESSFAAQSNTAIPPEFKQMLAGEVRAQLAAEKTLSEAPSIRTSNSLDAPPALDPSIRVFLVSSSLEVVSDGHECTLTPGDALLLPEPVAKGASEASLTVISTKKSGCAANARIKVAIADLQEMHNSFAEQIDNGLVALSAEQGKKGLPAAPDTTTQPSAEAKFASVESPTTIEFELDQQQLRAVQAEDQIQQEAFSSKQDGN